MSMLTLPKPSPLPMIWVIRPFGHAGEFELARLMEPYGGFEHNAQAIRIVTELERHYADFDGLNLTFGTLEGIAKHNGPAVEPVPYALQSYLASQDLALDRWPTVEAQVAAIADDIAYNCHDTLDGFRAGLIPVSDLEDMPVLGDAIEEVRSRYGGLSDTRACHEAIRVLFDKLVRDVVEQTRACIRSCGLDSPSAVRTLGRATVRFSARMQENVDVLRAYLSAMYDSQELEADRERGIETIKFLFETFLDDQKLLPRAWQRNAGEGGDVTTRARVVADYLSGMTNAFARQLFENLNAAASSQ